LAYKSYKSEVEALIRACQHEFCEGVGTLCVAEVQSIVPVLTGNLKKCITSEVMTDDAGVYIGATTGAPYAEAVEKGTSRQTSQPFLEDGVTNAIPKITSELNKVFQSKMGGV